MILVTGATGFLGKRVCRLLESNKVTFIKTSLNLGLDLRDESKVDEFFSAHQPTKIIHCAAYVGGIQFGYKHPAELFYNNMKMTLNLFEISRKYGVSRIVNPISNCAYPAKLNLYKEENFWDGELHESVLAYGMARKASWVASWAYAKQYELDVINLILSNMYGPEDHFEPERSHALGALIMKFVEAKRNNLPAVDVWGTGKPIREWLHVDDGAQAMLKSLDITPFIDPINVGIEMGISIADLAEKIKNYVGSEGKIKFDSSKPDGALCKTVDGTRGKALLGWSPEMNFDIGIKDTIEWYLKHRK